MKKINRRDFLKGAGYTAAAVAGGVGLGTGLTGAAIAEAEASPRMIATVPAGDIDRASFDFYTDHKSRLVAASVSESDREAVYEIQVRPIGGSTEPIRLVTKQVSGPEGFQVELNREQITLGAHAEDLECRISAPKGVAEQQQAVFAVTGRRGEESQEIRLKVTVLTAAPHWKMGRSETEVYDQPQKITRGKAVRFHLSLGNRGHLADRFAIQAKAPVGWSAGLTDEKGNRLSEIEVSPVSGMFQWEYPADVWLEVIPGPAVRKKENGPITVTAQSQTTGLTDQITVHAFFSEPLFSINDLDGLDPRPHHTLPGGNTGFGLHLQNPETEKQRVYLSVTGLKPGWQAKLGKEQLDLPAGGKQTIFLQVTPASDATEGASCRLQVAARSGASQSLGSVRLQVTVTQTPKLYFMVIDSLDYQYLTLNSKGDGPGREGDWLCPHIRRFLDRGVSFTNARCGMPSATDMNHTTIVSGANTGTLGAYWVSGYYTGLDEVGDITVVHPSPDVLRHGPEGERLTRIFDLVKARNPHARSVIISNKPWVSRLHEDGSALRWGITGSHFPVYAESPPKYVLGDPPTDRDPSDRGPVKPKELIVDANPLELIPQVLSGDFFLLKALFKDVGEFVGSKPGSFPDDRWIADTACKVIREEDPEVLYVNLAATDEAGHLFGAAWDPEEWTKAKGLFFGSHWVSKYSEQARRNEILDVVREADARFGQIVQEIDDRGMLDNSLVVFTADHSMVTEGYRNQGFAPLDIKAYLRSQGIIAPRHYGTAWGLNHWAAIFDVRDDATREVIRKLLQGMAVDDPEAGKRFHPCIVLGEEGIRTGRDTDNPFLPEAEKQITEPDELYSEYYMHHAEDSIHWPELCVFFRRHYQTATPGDTMIRGVNGMGEQVSLVARNNLRLVGIHGSRLTTHVPLVFAGPGIDQGRTLDTPARLHDILPTLCHLLGWEIPATAAGQVRRDIFKS